MSNNTSRNRVDELFSGMQQLASSEPPNGNHHPLPDLLSVSSNSEMQTSHPAFLLDEMESLRARVRELEAQLKEKESQTHATPLFYEREAVGFAYRDNKVLPIRVAQANIPNDSGVFKTPLLFSGQAIGEVQISQPAERTLTQEDLSLAHAVAQQASLQIENLRLLAAADRARAEAEEATHQFTHTSWASFLDAIHNSERIGYVYDQEAVEPFTQPLPEQYDHEETMQVLDQQIGRFFIKGNGTLTEEDKSLISAIAKQVSQQVESIRLLADASRARAEAEEASRQLTRQNWESYMQQEETVTGYVYDSVKVSPLGSETVQAVIDLEQPLLVRGEPIGHLAVSGLADVSQDAREFAAAIAAQTSIHMETLRLTEELQKRARELEEVHSFLDSVIENLPTMLFVKDAEDLRFVRWNKAEEELVGYKREDILGKNDYDLFPREEADVFTQNDRQVLTQGQLLDIPEEPLETVQRGLRYLHTRKVPIFGVDGKAKYLLGISEDITERKQTTEALARRATELATVAQVSTTASTVLDPDRLLQAVVDLTKERFDLYHVHVYLLNESWNTLLLASGSGEIGRKLVQEEHAIPMDAEQSLVARAARSGDVIIANQVQSEPGFLPNRLLPETQAEMAVPMIVGDRVLGVFDVQSNDAQGFSNEDASIFTTLASQVAVALQNARLYVEQSATVTQLRELDRLKSSFLANMSHELRTPLNSILGFSDVILEGLDGPLTENMDSDLHLIQKNGQHLLHLINDVLDMAKIEAGRMNLNPEKFRIYDVLDEVNSITSTLASAKNLALFIEDESDRDVEVYADHTRLRQVMINLVNNAIKFTETGKISLRVMPIEGARVLISVKDTGIGIPPDKLEAVFQEFTQVDTSSTRKVGGTGLGLPISRKLVEMHGGRLWAESTGIPGEGSIFFVELPIEARITEIIEKQVK